MALHHVLNPINKSELMPKRSSRREVVPTGNLLRQELFLQVLQLEQLRAQRSGRRFVLLLIQSGDPQEGNCGNPAVNKLLNVLASATRATDVTGWYEESAVIGVIFTEIGDSDDESVTNALLARVANVLTDSSGAENTSSFDISCQVLPGAPGSDEERRSFRWTRCSERN